MQQCFDGEDVDKLLLALNDQERDWLYRELRTLKRTRSVTEEQSIKIDFFRPPPSMEQFIDDDYYLGRTARHIEGENTGLYPLWRTTLIADFDLDSRIHNAVVTGSIGTGKSYVSAIIMLYRIAVTTLLRNPQNFFGGISRGSNIIYNMLSVTRETVRQTVFGQALIFMGASGYFLEELKFDPEMEYSKSVVAFRNNIFLTAGSKGWHVLGRNVLGVLLDEGNFRIEADPNQQAYALYEQVRTRISSRFQKIEGFLPAISIIASSAEDESSFTEQVIRDIEKAHSPKTQVIYRQPIYKVKRHELKLGPRWFRVSYGLKNQEPILLGGWFTEHGKLMVNEVAEEPPKGAKTELIPEMYWSDFRRNPRRALQDIAGISTGGTHRLFPNMVDVERCIELSEKEGLTDPAKGGVRLIPISSEDNLNLWDYLEHRKFLTRVQSRVLPLRHPNALRYAHLDLATQNKAGISVCHLVGSKKVEGVILDGKPFDEYRLTVEYDFILTVTAGQVKSISFDKICRFFFWLRDMCGYRFGLITADQYQSVMPLQTLEAAGFKVDKLSIDRDKSVYTAWKSGFEDLRIRLYRQQEMLDEAEQLMEGDKKFDHPNTQSASKDTSDACSGAYYDAINSEERTSLLTEATPSIHTNTTVEPGGPDAPIMEINLPSGTGRIVKEHQL